jgi:hypothetical protein
MTFESSIKIFTALDMVFDAVADMNFESADMIFDLCADMIFDLCAV